MENDQNCFIVQRMERGLCIGSGKVSGEGYHYLLSLRRVVEHVTVHMLGKKRMRRGNFPYRGYHRRASEERKSVVPFARSVRIPTEIVSACERSEPLCLIIHLGLNVWTSCELFAASR